MTEQAESDHIMLGVIPTQPRRRWARVETMLVISLLFMGGVGTGYFLADRQAEIDLAALREHDSAELSRALAERATRLNAVESRIDATAAKVQGAAATADAAAVTVDQAVTKLSDHLKKAGKQ